MLIMFKNEHLTYLLASICNKNERKIGVNIMSLQVKPKPNEIWKPFIILVFYISVSLSFLSKFILNLNNKAGRDYVLGAKLGN